MTLNARKLRFETLLIHGGTEPGPAGATTVPIVQSSSFSHETVNELKDVCDQNRDERNRNDFDSTIVQEGHQVEFLYLMGGGR